MKKHTRTSPILALALLAFWVSLSTGYSQGTTFTYQGRLADVGGPVSGNYDLRFTIWDSAVGGLQVGAAQVIAPVPVSGGLFQVPLNFGPGIFTGAPRWLQIESRVFGGGSYSTITPRQALTATPYAILAGSLAGTLPAGQLPCPIPESCLTPNVALLNRNQTFTGANIFDRTGGAGRLIVNGTTAIDSANFTGLGFQYSCCPFGEGAIMSSYNDGEAFLSFWTKPGPGYPITRQMIIDKLGNVAIDQNNANNGTFNDGTFSGVGLSFGLGSGEGIASKRTAGGNQYGLDFYTGFQNRMSILNNGTISYAGQLNKLDVADNFTAVVRAADFTMGHSSRRGSPGRALVDFYPQLIVNFGADWPETVVNGNFTAAGTRMFMGNSRLGHFAQANGFNFATSGATGYMIEQGFISDGESSGIYFDGDSITMWSPGDGNRLFRILDEDFLTGGGNPEKFWVDGAGSVFGLSFNPTSSRRFKENVAPLKGALDKVLRLQGVTFEWTKEKGGRPSIGFIAEDVAPVLPELVAWEDNGKDAIGLDYDKITAVTVEAIKELKAQKDQQIESLKKRNAELESRLAELEASDKLRETRLTTLEKLMQQQGRGQAQEASIKNGGIQ